MGLFGKKCPKCDSKNLNKVKPSVVQEFNHLIKRSAFPWIKGLKALNVCRDCGFSWEDR